MGILINNSYSTFKLKMIACITMLIDHCGLCYLRLTYNRDCFLYPIYFVARFLGRLAFPIFCFLLVQGFFHTKSLGKYLLRLALFAIISEIPFNYLVTRQFISFQACNVYVTLFLGLICVALVDTYAKKNPEGGIFCITPKKIPSLLLTLLAVALIIVLAWYIKCDYSICGILLILSFYLCKDRPGALFICAAINFMTFSLLELAGLISFLFIFQYNNKKGYSDRKLLQYGFYLFYPLHLTILMMVIYFFSKA